MIVASTREELRGARAALTGRVAVVMTMGALHEGHATLLREARSRADAVLLTVFINPLQFGAGEDLDRYPRTLEADLELLTVFINPLQFGAGEDLDRYPRTLEADLAVARAEGVDVVFTPTVDVVYGTGAQVRVSAGDMGTRFEGASRPGHFDGVLTVVLKLLNLTRPDVALFGQKDAQQLALIRRMVRDLDVPVEVVGVPTVREQDGLALSSRNRYLTPEQRPAALALSRALAAGDRAPLDTTPGVEPDYFARVRTDTFEEDPAGDLLVVAARVGTTRLIDNRILEDR